MRPFLLAACVSALACTLAKPARAEAQFATEIRVVDGFAGTNPLTTEGGYLLGVHAGEAIWLVDRVGLQLMGGAEIGLLYLDGRTAGPVDATASLSAEAGFIFLLRGASHPWGSAMSVSWAPRLLVNFAGGEVASPIGAEVAVRFGLFKIPVWFMKSYDGTEFLGGGLGVQF